MTLSVYMAMADAEVAPERESLYYGLRNDASVAGLRCFIAYHKDARQDFAINGRMRSLTHKQVAMHGLFARLAVTGEHATIRSMAKEANCAPSTVSRFMLKLQAWGEYAIDVTRGRYGGVKVRQRQIRDGLAAYASRAWERIKQAALRTKVNVASTILGTGEQVPGTSKVPTTYMDATLTAQPDWETLLEDARKRWLR